VHRDKEFLMKETVDSSIVVELKRLEIEPYMNTYQCTVTFSEKGAGTGSTSQVVFIADDHWRILKVIPAWVPENQLRLLGWKAIKKMFLLHPDLADVT